MNVGANVLQGHAVSIAALSKALSSLLGRTVIDKTSMIGMYDFNLRWNRDSTPLVGPTVPDTGPAETASIFTALEEQHGLKLRLTRGRIQVLIIDSARRATND